MAELWAVQGDQNSHGGGSLIAANPQTVRIGGIPVIEHSDPADPDLLCIPLGAPHCNPETAGGSGTVKVYGNPVHRNNDPRVCGATTIVSGQSTVKVG